MSHPLGSPDAAAQLSLGVPIWLEAAAMSVSGFFGAALTANRGAPVLGILIGGLVVGLGGGVIRDVLLNVIPVAISQSYLLPIVAAAALAGGLYARYLRESRAVLVVLQALSLGLLLVIGCEKAANFQISPWAVIALGLITASAGGAMLDALSGARAALLSQGRWHLTALVSGAIAFLILSRLATLAAAELVTVALVVTLRLLSFRHGWSCPELPKGK